MSERRNELEDIFHAALAIPPPERSAFLDRECPNTEIRTEIESLLANLELDERFLEKPVFELALGALEASTSNNLEGKVIGHFELQERIGRGGMGEVYRALDTKLNRIVALKCISVGFEADQAAKRKLQKEAQASAALDHPNICTAFGFEEIDGHQFIVMQYVDGWTLTEAPYLQPMEPHRFRDVGRQILAGVAFAHSHGILHRDLKPGNIMIDRANQVKILDFGLAKFLSKRPENERRDEHSQVSTQGLVMGTVGYMSPEQLRGEKLDFRSDIFSLGVIFYRLITGLNPFDRQSQAETIAAVLTEEVDVTSHDRTIGKIYSPEYFQLINKCLRKKPDDRFQSAIEVLVEFEKIKPEYRQTFLRKYAPLFLRLIIIALVVSVAIAAGIYFGSPSKQPTLAVLPVKSENLPPEFEYLKDGITELLIDRFAGFSGIRTKSRYLVDRYRDQQTAPQIAGRELNADAVVVGMLQPRDGQLVLTTRLFRTSDGQVIDTFEQTFNDRELSVVPNRIVERVLDKISYRLDDRSGPGMDRKGTENEDALKLYQRGRFHLTKGQSDDLEIALQCFTDAKDLDQNFAKAWSGLAETYLLLSAPGTKNAITPANAVAYSRSAAVKARELDPTSSEAYYSLGLLSLYYDWNWREAESNLRLSIDTSPEFIPARVALIRLLTWTGRFDEALGEAAKIEGIDPLSNASGLETVKIHYRRRDFAAAQEGLNRLKERAASNQQIVYAQTYVYLSTGKYTEAVSLMEELYRSEKPETRVFAAAPYGYGLAKLRKTEEALRVVADLEDLRRRGESYVPIQESAIIFTALGDTKKAFDTLEKACVEHFRTLPGLVSDPILSDLQTDARFSDLKACVNL